MKVNLYLVKALFSLVLGISAITLLIVFEKFTFKNIVAFVLCAYLICCGIYEIVKLIKNKNYDT